jgi:hypothetical protein
VTNRLTVVTGSVVDGSGRALTDYQVVVFPEHADQMKRGSFRRMRIERPDQQGQFRASGLPPGRYLAVAVTDLDPEDANDPDVLDALRKTATPVQVREAETVTLSLTMSRSSAAVP